MAVRVARTTAQTTAKPLHLINLMAIKAETKTTLVTKTKMQETLAKMVKTDNLTQVIKAAMAAQEIKAATWKMTRTALSR